LTKTLKFDEDVLDIIRAMDWQDNGKVGKLTCGQLDRYMYEKVNKALSTMGGKWNRSIGGHVFKLDPREQVEGLIKNGSLTVEKDGFFETPESVVKRMLELVPLPKNGELILEPSAGLGAIAKHLCGNITLIEKNPQRCEELRKQFKLAGVLDEIGWVDDVIVNKTTGHVLDGHLLVELAISRNEPTIPVKYIELTEAEEKEVLAVFDPLSALAGHDDEILKRLLEEVKTDNENVQKLLDSIAKESNILIGGGKEETIDPGELIDKA